VKRSEKEKRLASQFITRFFESFPLLYTEAINALIDLCEDDDVAVGGLFTQGFRELYYFIELGRD
jgi:hypothetical protein